MKADDIAIVPLDLDKTESLEVDFAFECFGRIDILVNNAGISQRSLARHTDVSVSERLSRRIARNNSRLRDKRFA